MDALEEEGLMVVHVCRVYQALCNQLEHEAVLTTGVRTA